MMDRSLGIWLMVIFGLSGTVVIVLAWLAPASPLERIVATIAGCIGVIIAASRGFTLRQTSSRRHEKEVPVKVELVDNS